MHVATKENLKPRVDVLKTENYRGTTILFKSTASRLSWKCTCSKQTRRSQLILGLTWYINEVLEKGYLSHIDSVHKEHLALAFREIPCLLGFKSIFKPRSTSRMKEHFLTHFVSRSRQKVLKGTLFEIINHH